MPYNSAIHDRKSIRLQGYDYSKPGLYFVTICCQDRANLFGEVANETMVLNDAGQIADACWREIPTHFPHAVLHEFVIMPNHVHGIIELVEMEVSPAPTTTPTPFRSPSRTIGSIIRGFKIGVTKWMRQNTSVYNVWQRNYHERIIKNDQSYQNISRYIVDNPKNFV